MDPIHSQSELDQLFDEPDTLYDIFELDEEWELNRQSNDHPFRRFLHIASDDSMNQRSIEHE